MIRHACKDGGWPCGAVQERAAWSGANTGHCSGCGQLFIGTTAFDLHQKQDDRGRPVCQDPATALRGKDGHPQFERVEKPEWSPPYAWARFQPNVKDWPGPEPLWGSSETAA